MLGPRRTSTTAKKTSISENLHLNVRHAKRVKRVSISAHHKNVLGSKLMRLSTKLFSTFISSGFFSLVRSSIVAPDVAVASNRFHRPLHQTTLCLRASLYVPAIGIFSANESR